MDDLIIFFTNISTELRSIFLISGLLFFLLLESGIPLFKMRYDKMRHGLINISFTIITLFINLVGAVGIIFVVQYCETNNTGILNMVDIPSWLNILFGLAILDFIGAWFIHWLEHSVKWMWKFHLIHHSDPFVDVTSGLRHHPGENILRLCFTILAIFISGASIGLVMLYQTISVFFAHLTHANINIPIKIDKFLSFVFVTPNFHKIHHHFVQPQTDSNYGNIFSIWDHLFRTTSTIGSIDKIIYGIDTHMNPSEHSNMKNLLMIPFQPYRAPISSKSDLWK
tara:strand:- start:224 stop:1069 length:846 start_codon:yes stop_codon:yes gene_type:complete